MTNLFIIHAFLKDVKNYELLLNRLNANNWTFVTSPIKALSGKIVYHQLMSHNRVRFVLHRDTALTLFQWLWGDSSVFDVDIIDVDNQAVGTVDI